MKKKAKNKKASHVKVSPQQSVDTGLSANLGQPAQAQEKTEDEQKPVENMVIQFGDHEVSAAEISEKVRKNCMEAVDSKEIKSIQIYVKPEDNRAYYVVNNEIEGNVELVSG